MENHTEGSDAAPTPEQTALSPRGHAARLTLKVVICSFPESNGKRNWTAMIKRDTPWRGLLGNAMGISIARGEYWNRVAYDAERVRVLLGDRQSEPHILQYGLDVTTPEEWTGIDPEAAHNGGSNG